MTLPAEWSEKDLLEHIKGLANATGYLYYHTWNSQRSTPGFPDLVLVKPPRVIFAECKVDNEKKGKLTVAQKVWLEWLDECPGVESYCWRPRDIQEIADVLGGKRA